MFLDDQFGTNVMQCTMSQQCFGLHASRKNNGVQKGIKHIRGINWPSHKLQEPSIFLKIFKRKWKRNTQLLNEASSISIIVRRRFLEKNATSQAPP